MTLETVEKRIAEDGILDDACVKKQIPAVQSCIVFLYAWEFFWKLRPEDRVARIKECLDRQSNSFDRLCRIVFSDASDHIQHDNAAFQRFFNMAETTRRFFEQDGAIGGFPLEPFVRLQASSNCYMVSACTWYTLMLQRQFPNAEHANHPIDVAQCARRKILSDDDALIRRVVKNQGGCAGSLALDLTQTRDASAWDEIRFDILTFCVPEKSRALLHSLKEYGFGLVAGFFVHGPFRKAATTSLPDQLSMPEQFLGYWKFDGVYPDCEGQFVIVDPDDTYADQKQRWQDKWSSYVQHLSDRSARRQRGILGPSSLFNDSSSTESIDQQSIGNNASVTGDPMPGAAEEALPSHSMVLLGGLEEKLTSGEIKIYFMLLNWWKDMPLVVVSADYLQACQCRVKFLVTDLAQDSIFSRKQGLYGESCYPDIGEDGTELMTDYIFGEDGADRQFALAE